MCGIVLVDVSLDEYGQLGGAYRSVNDAELEVA
jgi:hypothetical protein